MAHILGRDILGGGGDGVDRGTWKVRDYRGRGGLLTFFFKTGHHSLDEGGLRRPDVLEVEEFGEGVQIDEVPVPGHQEIYISDQRVEAF